MYYTPTHTHTLAHTNTSSFIGKHNQVYFSAIGCNFIKVIGSVRLYGDTLSFQRANVQQHFLYSMFVQKVLK